eukprot:14903764-Ditylum_brightwellii.AAC.1
MEEEKEEKRGVSLKFVMVMDATAIFLYLLPKGLKRVKALLEKAALERKRQQQEKKKNDDENDKPLLRI